MHFKIYQHLIQVKLFHIWIYIPHLNRNLQKFWNGEKTNERTKEKANAKTNEKTNGENKENTKEKTNEKIKYKTKEKSNEKTHKKTKEITKEITKEKTKRKLALGVWSVQSSMVLLVLEHSSVSLPGFLAMLTVGQLCLQSMQVTSPSLSWNLTTPSLPFHSSWCPLIGLSHQRF